MMFNLLNFIQYMQHPGSARLLSLCAYCDLYAMSAYPNATCVVTNLKCLLN